jgi:hypothetical protein
LGEHFVHGDKLGLARFNEETATLSLLEPEPLDLWPRQSIKAHERFALEQRTSAALRSVTGA